MEEDIARLEGEILKAATDHVKLRQLMEEKEAREQQLEEKMERYLYLSDLAERIANQ